MIDSIKKKACEIAVVLVCVAVFCIFVSMKEGYHMDELLSFELSNAEFNPWIVTTQPEGRLAKFVHNEIDGETFGETMGLSLVGPGWVTGQEEKEPQLRSRVCSLVSGLHWTSRAVRLILACIFLCTCHLSANQGPRQENDLFSVWSWLQPDSALGCVTRPYLSLVVFLCLALVSQLCW